ncbi:MAG: Carbon storage regulator [Brockia lithotrophica]|uniref:Translational regulator CsrA n=1 Tax=Brockia lithotrophica TaxID=933949 RepID=A0A2T5G462_9BACL|nr:carbon storage regulator CsrA [Brockia lithotrophica]PTQ50980.1 MAG: Carbon storage regulator [Brockia lithotrophica]
MLVLSRKAGEAILLGDDVEVVVLGVEGDTVRLGIRAPRHVPIWRKELLEAVAGENRAATADPASLRDLFREPGFPPFPTRPSAAPQAEEKKTPPRD